MPSENENLTMMVYAKEDFAVLERPFQTRVVDVEPEPGNQIKKC